MADTQKIGHVTHYFGKIQVAVIELDDGELKVGDKIKISGDKTDLEQTVESMQVEKEPVESAKEGDSFGLKVNDKVRVGDEVHLATE